MAQDGDRGGKKEREDEMMAGIAQRLLLVAGVLLLSGCAALMPESVETAAATHAVYDSEGEPKALGVRFLVSYPLGWQVSESRGNSSIIRSFRHHDGGLMEHIVLQAMPLADEDAAVLFGDGGGFITPACRAKWVEILGKVNGAVPVDIRATTLDGRPAVRADMAVVRTKPGSSLHIESRSVMLYAAGRMLLFSCGVAGSAAAKDAVSARFRANSEGVCREFYESVKLLAPGAEQKRAAGYVVYDSKDEPKAQGVRFLVSYPPGWRVVENREKNSPVVLSLQHFDSGLMENMIVETMPLSPEAAAFLFRADDGAATQDSHAKLAALARTGNEAVPVDIRQITFAGRPAVQVDKEAVMDYGSSPALYVRMLSVMVPASGQMLTFSCSVSAGVAAKDAVTKQFQTNTQGVCREFFGSVKLPD